MNMLSPARASYQTRSHVSSGLAAGVARARAVVPAHVDADDGMASLDRIGLTRRLHRGQELFAEGDRAATYYKVASGAVRLLRLMPDGRRHVVDFFVAGDFFGFTPLESYAYSAEAVIDAVVVAYPRRGVNDLVGRRPRAIPQERLGGPVDGDVQAAQLEQHPQRIADRFVVVDDVDGCPVVQDRLGPHCPASSQATADRARSFIEIYLLATLPFRP